MKSVPAIMRNAQCGFRYPGQVNYFTRAKMARSAGLEMRIENRLNHPVDDNLTVLLTKA